MSYSREGQDKWILSQVTEPGYFVEVGARDGVKTSNSLLLEQNGWTGVCVEADVNNFHRLVANRPKAKNFHCAVYHTDGEEVKFFLGESSGCGSIYKGNYQSGSVTVLKTKTLTSILEESEAPTNIDYISVDVEGAELDVLKGFDFEKYKVDYWTVEVEHNNEVTTSILEMMTSHGYKVCEQTQAPHEFWLKRS